MKSGTTQRRKAPRSTRKPTLLSSKVTARSQTTLPSGVRKALGLGPGDEIEYVIEGDRATIRRKEPEDDRDPALAAFLDLLEADIAEHPERVTIVTREMAEGLRALVAGVPVDLDEPIEGPVAL